MRIFIDRICSKHWELTKRFPLSRKHSYASHQCFLSGGQFDSWSTAWSVWVIRGWLDESACGGRVWTGMGFGGCGVSEVAAWPAGWVETKITLLELKGSFTPLTINKDLHFLRIERHSETDTPRCTHTHTHSSSLAKLWLWCSVKLELANRQKSSWSSTGCVRLLEFQEFNLRYIYKAHILSIRSAHCPLPDWGKVTSRKRACVLTVLIYDPISCLHIIGWFVLVRVNSQQCF